MIATEFDSSLAFFLLCDSDCILARIDGSDARRMAPVKQFNRKRPIAAADIDQTPIANAHHLQSSFRDSLVSIAAAQRCICRINITPVTAYIRAKRFDRAPLSHGDLDCWLIEMLASISLQSNTSYPAVM